MGEWTDQDEPREVEGRLAPPTTPNKDSIAEDRKDAQAAHEADRMPTEDEEAAAERAGGPSPEAAQAYKEAAERGANLEGEGKI